jgi:DNA replication protein DnaC
MKTLAQILAVPLTFADEERSRRFHMERERQRLRDWWSDVSEQLPDWSYARFANPEWTARVDAAALAAVRRWDPLRGGGLVLCGPTGVGKSSAIVARLRAACAGLAANLEANGELPRLPAVRWVTEEALMRDAYRWHGDDDVAAWAKAQARPRIFIVDEVGFAGGERAPTGRTPALMAAVYARYDRGLATTITTGLSPEQFVERYGVAVWRRLDERAHVVQLSAS